MKCPIDNTDLMMTTREGIEIDYCPKCRGIWLDRGELEKLIERSARYETAPPVRQDYDSDVIKRKNDEIYTDTRHRYHDDDDDYDPRYRENDPRYPKKKRGFLGDLFDIFD